MRRKTSSHTAPPSPTPWTLSFARSEAVANFQWHLLNTHKAREREESRREMTYPSLRRVRGGSFGRKRGMGVLRVLERKLP
jgi:hypothetical protein